MEILKDMDVQAFLAINGNHNNIFDFLMYWASNKFIWIPLYLFFLYLLIKNYRWKTLGIFLSIILLIVLSDQGSVHLFKNVFQRLRPCHEPQLEGLVHLVKGKCGGSFGFISSHASNSFALAVFLIKFLGKRYRFFTISIFVWATIISYSRIYLGAHYPSDVVVGAVFGSLLGFVVFLLYKFLNINWDTKQIRSV